jgi:fumarate reductase flavoprotein subunit
MKERDKGNTIPGPYGDVVHLDIRHLGEEKINKKVAISVRAAENYAGIDPVHQPIPCPPCRALHDGRHPHQY